jgi:acetolactate synthase-1/2/3 large subunit
MPRPAAAPHEIAAFAALLRQAKKPVILSGSGIIWSQASEAMQRFVEAAGIPFFTTPQGRGVIPDDHRLSFPPARASALREADLVIVLGTRLNYIWGQGATPRFHPDAAFVQVDIDPTELTTTSRVRLGILADARTFLEQALTQVDDGARSRFAPWINTLGDAVAKRLKNASDLDSEAVPIHPLRLCREVRDFMDRDAILVVDGQEILNFGRQSIPTFVPGHRLNSGTFGTMGVGLPLGVGAKAAKPDSQVIVLHGDGSFGWNAMELDTAVRHKLPILVIISLNGGMSSDPERNKPGRDLGYTRFDLMAQSLGCHGEYVENPGDIRPALQRAAKAVAAGQVALVNVVTDWRARATTLNFTQHMT